VIDSPIEVAQKTRGVFPMSVSRPVSVVAVSQRSHVISCQLMILGWTPKSSLTQSKSINLHICTLNLASTTASPSPLTRAPFFTWMLCGWRLSYWFSLFVG
jgi:hypothetical protein